MIGHFDSAIDGLEVWNSYSEPLSAAEKPPPKSSCHHRSDCFSPRYRLDGSPSEIDQPVAAAQVSSKYLPRVNSGSDRGFRAFWVSRAQPWSFIAGSVQTWKGRYSERTDLLFAADLALSGPGVLSQGIENLRLDSPKRICCLGCLSCCCS